MPCSTTRRRRWPRGGSPPPSRCRRHAWSCAPAAARPSPRARCAARSAARSGRRGWPGVPAGSSFTPASSEDEPGGEGAGEMTLSGRIVLITGASAGIGAACARAFAREGARLVLVARRAERLQELADKLRGSGTDVLALEMDVRDGAAVAGKIGALPAEWSAIDVLVNNAGLGRGLDKLWEGSPADWDEMVDTNVKGLLYFTRAVVPGMVERGHGHVINL